VQPALRIGSVDEHTLGHYRERWLPQLFDRVVRPAERILVWMNPLRPREWTQSFEFEAMLTLRSTAGPLP